MEVCARHLVRVDLNVPLFGWAEARKFSLDDVNAGHEARELIRALVVRDCRLTAADATRSGSQGYVDAGEHAPGGVGNSTADRSHALGHHRRSGYSEQQQCRDSSTNNISHVHSYSFSTGEYRAG